MKMKLSVGAKVALIASLCAGLVITSVLWFILSSDGNPPSITVTIGISIIAIIVMSAALIVLSRLLIDHPLEELIGLMKDAKDNDYLVRAPIRSGDVVGRLAQSFNEMLKRITSLDAEHIETQRELQMTQRELAFKKALEKKNKELEEARLRLQNQLNDISLLYDVGHAISSNIEFDALFFNLKEVIGNRLGFSEFVILIYDEKADDLVVKIAHGFREEVQGMHFKVGEGISGFVFQTGEMMYVQDTAKEPRYLRYKGEKVEDVAFLCIPLIWKGKTIGVMNFSRPNVQKFSEEEITLLRSIANHVAVAVANAQLYAKMKELSIKDELTGLYNRRHLSHTLNIELKRAKRFNRSLSLLMVDIDHFKNYNDNHGHLEGDEVLKKLAMLVKSHVREVDFIARYGGEEFVILLPNTPKPAAGVVATKLLDVVRDNRFSDGGITVSIGVSAYPEDSDMPENLIDYADVALYEAKKQGRDRCVIASGR